MFENYLYTKPNPEIVMNFTKKKQNDAFKAKKPEHFKALVKNDHTSAIADHKTTGHNIKRDHLDILASGKTYFPCKLTKTY